MIRFYRVGLIFLLLFFIFSCMSFVCADENVNSTTLVKDAIDDNVTDDEIISLEDYSEEIILEEKTDTIIDSQNRTFYKNSNDQYNISLKDDLGNPIANASLIFQINNNTYNHTTDNEGYVFLNINSLELGEYIIKTRFLGDNFYNPANTTNHIIIKSTIISSDLTKVYTSETKLCTQLKHHSTRNIKSTSLCWSLIYCRNGSNTSKIITLCNRIRGVCPL